MYRLRVTSEACRPHRFWWLLLVSIAALQILPAAAQAQLEAGMSSVPIALPAGVPLAGWGGERRAAFPDLLGLNPYAYYLKGSTGVRDPIQAKVLLLEAGGKQLAFIALDIVGVSAKIRQAIIDRIQQIPAHNFDPEEIFVSATHTHSGPGALTDNPVFEFTTTDRFDSQVFDLFMDGVELAFKKALDDRDPAKLSTYRFETTGLTKNRRRPADGPVDPYANVLLVEADTGSISGPPVWRGAMVNFAIHGTSFRDDNLQLSADVPGAIAAELGKRLGVGSAAVPVLFVNGAEGDAAPIQSNDGNDPANMNLIAIGFADAAMAKIGDRQPVEASWTTKRTEVDLKSAFLYFAPLLDLQNPTALRRLGIQVPDSWFPAKFPVWSIRLGEIRMLTWPGEATASLGLVLRSAAQARGFKDFWLLGLTNEHLAYFTSPYEYETVGGYEASVSLYGPHGGAALANALGCLLE